MKELFTLFFEFFKIGLFTFGGGYAMIAQVRELCVEKKKWLTEDELVQMLAVAESTPGPIAINMATYVGFNRKKVLGSAFATLGVVLPSFIIILIISFFVKDFMANKYVAFAFRGINCAVAFLILKTGISMLLKMKKKLYPILAFALVFLAKVLFEFMGISFSAIYFILIGGIIGIVLYAVLKGGEAE